MVPSGTQAFSLHRRRLGGAAASGGQHRQNPAAAIRKLWAFAWPDERRTRLGQTAGGHAGAPAAPGERGGKLKIHC